MGWHLVRGRKLTKFCKNTRQLDVKRHENALTSYDNNDVLLSFNRAYCHRTRRNSSDVEQIKVALNVACHSYLCLSYKFDVKSQAK